MVKKPKNDVPNPNSVANRDIIQRLNFMYQASVLLNGIPDSSVRTSSQSSGERKRKRRRYNFTAKDLSRVYVESMQIVSKKTMVKMDPTVKRTLCKGCSVILVPGTTASVRVKTSSSHGHAVTYTCIACKTTRRIPAPPPLVVDAGISCATGADDSTPRDPSRSGTDKNRYAQSTSSGRQAPVLVDENRTGGKKKKGLAPRLPPLFARDVGHVTFRGNENLEALGDSFCG